MTSDIATASFIILSPNGSSFAKLLDEVVKADKDALKYTFIEACQRDSRIVDISDHLLKPENWGSRGRKSPKRRTNVGRYRADQSGEDIILQRLFFT